MDDKRVNIITVDNLDDMVIREGDRTNTIKPQKLKDVLNRDEILIDYDLETYLAIGGPVHSFTEDKFISEFVYKTGVSKGNYKTYEEALESFKKDLQGYISEKEFYHKGPKTVICLKPKLEEIKEIISGMDYKPIEVAHYKPV